MMDELAGRVADLRLDVESEKWRYVELRNVAEGGSDEKRDARKMADRLEKAEVLLLRAERMLSKAAHDRD